MSQSFPVQTTYRDNVLRISMLIVRKIGCNRETRQTLMVFTGFGFFMCTKFFGHYCLHKLAQIALRGNVRLSITELSLYKNLKRSFSSLLSPPPPYKRVETKQLFRIFPMIQWILHEGRSCGGEAGEFIVLNYVEKSPFFACISVISVN